ncbi:restriction endonuclease subunit S [Aliarcobacter butzleri]
MSNLPKGWKEVLIENVFDNIGGTSLEKFVNENGKYKFISIGNYSKFGRYIDNNQRIDINEKSANKILNKNDLVMVLNDKTSTGDIIGSSILIEENDKYIYNQRSERLICKDNIYPKFAWQLLNSKYFRKKIVSLSQGGTQIYINFPIIKKINFFLPPLEEQKKISDILSTVDKKIAFVEENINATEELKKGLMQKLLTEGIGHTEFKDSELGRIPESWEIIPLDKVIALLTDYHANGSYEKLKENVELLEKENYAVMVRTTNFEKNDFTENLIYITEHAYNYLKKSKVYENDIVINKIANAGATYIMPKLDKPVSLAMNLFLLKLIDTVDNRFIYLQIKIREDSLKALSSGTSTKTITKNDVKGFKIALAPYEEQKQIAEILLTVDNKLENLKEKKQYFEELKKGLMQKLLTGKIRV